MRPGEGEVVMVIVAELKRLIAQRYRGRLTLHFPGDGTVGKVGRAEFLTPDELSRPLPKDEG